MLVDTFLVADEWPMMELRLRTLADVVDAQIAVRCRTTHQGQPANLEPVPHWFYNAFPKLSLYTMTPNLARESKGRVYERPINERGGAGSPFFQHIEAQHRNACLTAARTITDDPDAVILVSDVDEIPRPEIIAELGSDLGAAMFSACKWWTLEMAFFSGSIDYRVPQAWFGTCASRLADCEPQAQRDARGTVDLPDAECGVITDAGWHISWTGTDDERARKRDTFSHAELAHLDLPALRAAHRHVDGLALVHCPFPRDGDLPLPLLDGSFAIPESWRST